MRSMSPSSLRAEFASPSLAFGLAGLPAWRSAPDAILAELKLWQRLLAELEA